MSVGERERDVAAIECTKWKERGVGCLQLGLKIGKDGAYGLSLFLSLFVCMCVSVYLSACV